MQQHIMQRFYSTAEKGTTGGRSGDRKKLKRQSVSINSADMDISANSLLCGMQQFDRAVQNMEETILVPSRLMDMTVVGDSADKQRGQVPALLLASDAYDVFQLLKSVRSTVRRGGCGESEDMETKPLHRQSSLKSSQSLSSLSSEGSCSAGAPCDDSGHESEDPSSGSEAPCEAVRARFESHLSGLSQCLAQMTEAAAFLSSRYEQQLDSGF